MRIVHVAPTPFGSAGHFGGGERYPLELARTLALEVDSELISFGRCSALVQESGELRERLAELLSDRTLAARMGRNARDLVLDRFTWRACAQRCLAAYRALCQ